MTDLWLDTQTSAPQPSRTTGSTLTVASTSPIVSKKRFYQSILGLSSTIKHELLHALGFSSSLFAFFRAPDGSPLTERQEDGKPAINNRLQVRQWSDKIIKTVR